MRLAALYDIHGNLPALDAVLEEVARECVDQIVVGGDVVPGPMAREALARLRSLSVPMAYLQGNCEVAVLAAMAGRDHPAVPEEHRPLVRWTATQLHQEYGARLASWPMTVTLDLAGIGRVLFCHGTPQDDNGIFTSLTPEALLRPLFDPLGVAMVICGHSHMQFDRLIGRTRVVNAGSVGMPFGEEGAAWLLLTPDVELRHAAYDIDAAAAMMRATDYPEVETFVKQYVLHQPPAAAMLDLFTNVSLKRLSSQAPT